MGGLGAGGSGVRGGLKRKKKRKEEGEEEKEKKKEEKKKKKEEKEEEKKKKKKTNDDDYYDDDHNQMKVIEPKQTRCTGRGVRSSVDRHIACQPSPHRSRLCPALARVVMDTGQCSPFISHRTPRGRPWTWQLDNLIRRASVSYKTTVSDATGLGENRSAGTPPPPPPPPPPSQPRPRKSCCGDWKNFCASCGDLLRLMGR